MNDYRSPFGHDAEHVVYLGEVRRRRRREFDSRKFAGLVMVAVLAVVVWLVVVFTLPPARLLTYAAFFAPLWLAATAIAAGILYVLQMRTLSLDPGGFAVPFRRGALLATVAVINLAFVAGHAWTPLVGVVTIALAAAFDLVAHLRRARSLPPAGT